MKYILGLLVLFSSFHAATAQLKTDVVIVGGGASGTTAAIQVARLGVKTVVLEETSWLGGMLTAAGVSAIDGNHRLPAGLWGEFRAHLYKHYGGAKAVETGWVSNTLFEPAVGNRILKEMVAAESNIQVIYETAWQKVQKTADGWLVETKNKNGKSTTVAAKVLIDATELGDVMAYLQVPYYLGMDSKSLTNEPFALAQGNDIVQDLTYVVTLKDFGKGADKTIAKPANYNKDEFAGSCDVADPATFDKDNNDCFRMLTYGRLPNNKFMINWPKKGNDIYLNIVEKSREERQKMLVDAKQMTLRFVYYIQNELGFKNLGIDYDEYPTKDGFPMIPYHRESRRLKAKSLFALQHVMTPYDTPEAYYRTGVVVGDYTIDHHHYKYGNAPEIDFVKIRVPSYNVPMGSLIPADFEGLIVSEKSIGVTNIVNGATRLQPVVLGIGQAVGTIAGIAVKKGKLPSQVSIREVQESLLDNKALIMPFIDVLPGDSHFKAMQKIGATGILRGTGIPYRWANQTWFYPEREVSQYELMQGLRTYYPVLNTNWNASGEALTVKGLQDILKAIQKEVSLAEIRAILTTAGFKPTIEEQTVINRRWTSVLLDQLVKPFEREVDYDGSLKTN
ncbi:FAD-dependent oxidoreductase [Sphingobacterium psychroaquaticum]|uniref:FAD dependent oxidoreductase n=1 Tax=Sphingobacterium psychroaquaticum TaxID=561061 RepID=A0A1X7KJ10_9SPHI|nr:FAD-dependent oxidoreductase [Sphingobacterium psychroaquaticum]SMG40659.1 FAD dependent oxidoreductase [Sphingobacterium psychroaquaticum]